MAICLGETCPFGNLKGKCGLQAVKQEEVSGLSHESQSALCSQNWKPEREYRPYGRGQRDSDKSRRRERQ